LSINRTGERKKKREELAKLKHSALAELERRGYEVRGKTPAQIREMLKRHPKRLRANSNRVILPRVAALLPERW
jgi:hypothetical protein